MADAAGGGPARPRIADALWRAAYRAAYLALRAFWFVARPRTRGAHVAVYWGGKLLLIRNSYRSEFSLPGGGVGRRESPRDAALRELAEETGICCAGSDLVPFARMRVEHDHLRDDCHFFELSLEREPLLRVDNREIVWAGFVDPADLEPGRLHAPTRAYLTAAREETSNRERPR